jgi:hypothetical protein
MIGDTPGTHGHVAYDKTKESGLLTLKVPAGTLVASVPSHHQSKASREDLAEGWESRVGGSLRAWNRLVNR